MATDNIDFAGFLAVLEAKRAALDALIGSYRAALSLGALGQMGDVDIAGGAPTTAANLPIELPKGAFLNKSLRAAIKLYLSSIRQKQTSKEITAALKEGGVESTSDNFESVVLAALATLKKKGDVLRFKDGWAFAEFYPQHLRSSLGTAKNAKPKTVPKKRTAKPTSSTKKSAAKSAVKRESPASKREVKVDPPVAVNAA